MVKTVVCLDVCESNRNCTKKFFNDYALFNLSMDCLPNFEEIWDDNVCANSTDIANLMREQYHARIVNVDPMIVDNGEEWRFIIRYEIEWDGPNKEEL